MLPADGYHLTYWYTFPFSQPTRRVFSFRFIFWISPTLRLALVTVRLNNALAIDNRLNQSTEIYRVKFHATHWLCASPSQITNSLTFITLKACRTIYWWWIILTSLELQQWKTHDQTTPFHLIKDHSVWLFDGYSFNELANCRKWELVLHIWTSVVRVCWVWSIDCCGEFVHKPIYMFDSRLNWDFWFKMKVWNFHLGFRFPIWEWTGRELFEFF